MICSYLGQFVELNGVDCVTGILFKCRERAGRDSHAAAALRCFRALLNSTVNFLLFALNIALLQHIDSNYNMPVTEIYVFYHTNIYIYMYIFIVPVG